MLSSGPRNTALQASSFCLGAGTRELAANSTLQEPQVVERDSQGRLVWRCGARGGWCGVGWDCHNDVEHVAAEEKGLVDVAVTGEEVLFVPRGEADEIGGHRDKALPGDVAGVGDAEDVVAVGNELEVEEAVVAGDVGGGDLLLVVAGEEGDGCGVDGVGVGAGGDAAGELVELRDRELHVLSGELLTGGEFDAGGLGLAGRAAAVKRQR